MATKCKCTFQRVTEKKINGGNNPKTNYDSICLETVDTEIHYQDVPAKMHFCREQKWRELRGSTEAKFAVYQFMDD